LGVKRTGQEYDRGQKKGVLQNDNEKSKMTRKNTWKRDEFLAREDRNENKRKKVLGGKTNEGKTKVPHLGEKARKGGGKL